MRSGLGIRAGTYTAGCGRWRARGKCDASRFALDQPLGVDQGREPGQSMRLRFERAAARRLKSEDATTVVAARGELSHEPRFFHALERAVDRARPHAHLRAGRLLHRLHDGVAVEWTIGKRKKDVEHRGSQRGAAEGRNRLGHGSILLPLRIYG